MGRLYTLYITLLPICLRILLRRLMKILQKKSILLSEEVICGEKTFKRIIILLKITKNLMYRDAILGILIYVHGSKFPKENISWIK